MKQWRKDNPDKVKEVRKKYDKKHREKLNEESRKWRENNPEKARIIDKKSGKKWRIKNKEYLKEYRKKYDEGNKEYRREYRKKRRRIDLKYNLNCRISSAIWCSIRGNKNNRHWEDLVGYTLEDLIKKLNKTMPEGYNWQNYIEGKLHIDHIVPISAHNFDNPNQIDFKRCWSLNNLQLLPAKENITKSDILTKPFQPALNM